MNAHKWPYGVVAGLFALISTAYAQVPIGPIGSGTAGGGSSGFPITIGSTSIASGSTTTTIAGLTLTTPVIGAATGTSLALNSCTLGGNTLCTTGAINAVSGTITGAGIGSNSAAAQIFWQTRSAFSSPADGTIEMLNNAGTGFSFLQFGGTTSSFPALAVSGTGLKAILADNSADAAFEALSFKVNGTAGASCTLTTIAHLTVVSGIVTLCN